MKNDTLATLQTTMHGSVFAKLPLLEHNLQVTGTAQGQGAKGANMAKVVI